MTGNLAFVFVVVFALLQTSRAKFESRENLSFVVNAVYSATDEVDYIGIRGSGLGLDWASSRKMVEAEKGVWSYEFVFSSDIDGFHCSNCTSEGRVRNGDDLKVIFFIKLKNSDEVQMMSEFFRIPMPQSRVSSYFASKPVHTFHPYFFSKRGTVEVLEVTSPDEKIGTRRITLYLPPGFAENTKPIYDVYYVLDLYPKLAEQYMDVIDQIFVDGAAHDAIVVGHGDFRYDDDEVPDRTLQLIPTEGDDLVCNEGYIDNGCDGCVPWVSTDEEWFYWMLDGGCGHAIKSGGNADSNIDFLLKEVNEKVNAFLSEYESSLTESRDGTFVIGFSHGGLFACHAAWKYPQFFGGAACQSASFWWPWVFEKQDNKTRVFSAFNFVNETLKENLTDRLPQKIVIDVGEPEEDALYYSVSMADKTSQIIEDHPMFQANQNVWFQVYPGLHHTTDDWMNRLWKPFTILSDGRN